MKIILILVFFMYSLIFAYIKGYNNGVFDGKLEEKRKMGNERKISDL